MAVASLYYSGTYNETLFSKMFADDAQKETAKERLRQTPPDESFSSLAKERLKDGMYAHMCIEAAVVH